MPAEPAPSASSAVDARVQSAGLLPSPLGTPIALAYRAIMARRNRAFDRRENVTQLRVPVISIGNLSVGGTGKTPMVMELVRWLRDSGHAPVVSMRGYRPAGRGSTQPSDEHAEYRLQFPDLPVVVSADRATALSGFLSKPNIAPGTVVVLDDGFQHRFVARNLDIVLIDALRDPLRDRCLPVGWLREPVQSLGRAGAIVLTRTDLVDPSCAARLESSLRNFARPETVFAHARHAWSSLDVHIGEAATGESTAWLARRPVVVACAIGNPHAFIAQVRAAGATIIRTIIRRDHHAWKPRDMDQLASLVRAEPVDGVVTTCKDWVKLSGVPRRPASIPFIVPRVRIEFTRGLPQLREAVLKAAVGHGPAEARRA